MKQIFSLVSGALLICTFTAAAFGSPSTPVKLSASDVKNIQSSMRAQMKDPDSTRFGAISGARYADGDLYVCGWVNGKNSYGGYTGMMPYAGHYYAQKKQIDVAVGGARDLRIIQQMCAEQGVALPENP